MSGTDYSSYLHIDELLRLQCPLTEGADDEMLFIVVHQAYELWFKLILHELGLARDRLAEGEPWAAAPRLSRAVAAEELLMHHLSVLETMSPDGFLRFRDPLAPASGFQSTQFREIEVLSQGGEAAAPSPSLSDVQQAAIRRRAGEPSLWDALVATLARHGLLPAGASVTGASTAAPELLGALASAYHDHGDPVRASIHEVCELLVDHDETIARWRYRHALMAARQIGRRTGTGGSLGVAYLETTLGKRLFPLLWQVRSHL